MMATVAGGATLELSLEDGVKVEEVFGYAWSRKGNRTVIRLGDVFAGQRRSILVKLRVPGKIGSKSLGDFTVLYDDMTEGGERGSAVASAKIQVTNDRPLVRKNRNQEVEARIGEIELATQMQEAARMVEEGRYDDAKGILDHAKQRAQAKGLSLGSAGADLRGGASEADELLQELEAAPSSPKLRKSLIKRSKGKAYRIQKK